MPFYLFTKGCFLLAYLFVISFRATPESQYLPNLKSGYYATLQKYVSFENKKTILLIFGVPLA